MSYREPVNNWLKVHGGDLPPVLVHDVRRWVTLDNADDPLMRTFLEHSGANTAGSWPLTYKGREIGAFFLCRMNESSDDASLVSFFLSQVSLFHEIITERRIAEETSRRDALTGLLNRQGFLDHVEPILASAKRHFGHVVLAVVDVNDLKLINDSGGHLAGDRVLRQVAASLASRVREGDVVGRWGGDEFVVLMETGKPDTSVIAHRLRGLAHDERSPSRVSVGCSVFGRDGKDFESCFEVADQRCLMQKKWKS